MGAASATLPRLRAGARRRSSSWDTHRGQRGLDHRRARRNRLSLLTAEGAGSINHIWIGIPDVAGYRGAQPESRNADALQRLVLEMRWDGEESPSVLVPLGAFFGGTHVETAEFVSSPIQVGPRDARSFTSFFHMPFASGARVSLRSESEDPIRLWFYVDYEQFDRLEPEIARFHATWNRQRFDGESDEGSDQRGVPVRGQQPERRGQLRAALRGRAQATTSAASSRSTTSVIRTSGTGTARATT